MQQKEKGKLSRLSPNQISISILWMMIDPRLFLCFWGASMPVTKEHAMRAEYLRENGELVAKLAERLGVHIEEAWASVEIGDSELTNPKPVEARADGVLVYRNAEGKPVLAVAIEIQRSFDEKKFRVWPFYAASLMHQYGCRAIVLVLVSSPALAQAYREREYAHGSFLFCPYILDATTIPEAEASTPCG